MINTPFCRLNCRRNSTNPSRYDDKAWLCFYHPEIHFGFTGTSTKQLKCGRLSRVNAVEPYIRLLYLITSHVSIFYVLQPRRSHVGNGVVHSHSLLRRYLGYLRESLWNLHPYASANCVLQMLWALQRTPPLGSDQMNTVVGIIAWHQHSSTALLSFRYGGKTHCL